MEDLLVLVNENDEVTGTGPKLPVHREKLLHRAFSIFLYDRESDSLLLQQRAIGKYHSGGLWSNSCCSHPRAGEVFAHALARRLKDELAIDVPEDRAWIRDLSEEGDSLLFPGVPETELAPFCYCGRFLYLADYGELAEHEIDRVFLLEFDRSSDAFRANPEEIADTMWMKREMIRELLLSEPEHFSAWFERAFRLADAGIGKMDTL